MGETLQAHGLKIGRGKMVAVDENGWTGCGRIYAVGDVAGANLATAGQAQALRAVRTMFGSGKISGEKLIQYKPSGVWTIPELAWVGLTEEEAEKASFNYGTARVEYSQTVRGCVTNDDGFLKLIYDRDSGRVL